MKKIKIGMIGWIVIAILTGAASGFAFTHLGATGQVCLRVFKTFNVLFAQILKFIVPLLILGLVTPAIASAGKGAGKLLGFVMVFSYLSTCAAAFFGYFAAGRLLPLYLAKGAVAAANDAAKLLPYVDIKIPAVCDVLTALVLAFMVGVGIVVVNAERLKYAAEEFAAIVTLTIRRVIIPGGGYAAVIRRSWPAPPAWRRRRRR